MVTCPYVVVLTVHWLPSDSAMSILEISSATIWLEIGFEDFLLASLAIRNAEFMV